MKVRFALLSAALAALSFAPTATADSASTAKSAIQALHTKMDAAIAKKDAAGSLNCYATDYKSVRKDGKVTEYAQLKQQLPQVLKAAKSITASSKVSKCVTKGAFAQVLVDQKGVMTLVHPKTGKQAVITMQSRDIELWQKTKSGWTLKSSQEIASKNTVDGREF